MSLTKKATAVSTQVLPGEAAVAPPSVEPGIRVATYNDNWLEAAPTCEVASHTAPRESGFSDKCGKKQNYVFSTHQC